MNKVDDFAQTERNVNFRQLGNPLPRIDSPGKVFGETLYAGDYSMANMLHAKILRSPLPSACLKSLDVSKARALEGVACVLTFKDLKKKTIVTGLPGLSGSRPEIIDHQVLVDEIARYQGEPIALIAAETLEIAERACALIEFDLEPLPGVYDVFEAQKPGAPIVYGEDNIVAEYKARKGDVEAGFLQADTIVENTFTTQFVEHAFLEPEIGLAWVDDQGVVNIRTSTQRIEHFRSVAAALDIPHSKVRFRGAMLGGGFGGKCEITTELFVALLATTTKRPVRLCYTREESFYGHGKRHPFVITHKTGFDRDGKITAAKIDITSESGPYAFMSHSVLLSALEAGAGPYRVGNLHIDARSIATNNMYTSAFRGFGATQACIAYEQQMDEAARVLGIDPLELRRINFMNTGDTNAVGATIKSAVWSEQCMSKAWAALGDPLQGEGPIKHGRGVAASLQGYGRLVWTHDTAEGWVGLELDGTVVVRSGITDVGSGQVSALAQIAGEILGVDMQTISVYNSDTSTTPLAGITAASRGLYMSGNAVRLAAEAIRDRLATRAAQAFGVKPTDIDFAGSNVFVIDHADKSIPLAKLISLCAYDGVHLSELAIFRAPFGDVIDMDIVKGQVHPDFTFGAHAIEVAVDTDTGEVSILKSIGVHDVGQAINAQAVEGQIEGCAAQGHGYALCEELIYEEGCLVTPSLSEYLCPTAMDCPEIQSIILESRSGLGPFGAKAIGEAGLAPVASAVANAVANAIGVRVHDFPLTPEKILAAINESA
ncbi:MAG: xanthine dehydrogenase family protein [Rhodospirillales bacterium]|jgi:CO/xanthine dehydrogenase Mo-binding subunit|nr:xanthine dehydrogenase family protein [Rhodospirillales bacterium]